jgi:hypothetical protein
MIIIHIDPPEINPGDVEKTVEQDVVNKGRHTGYIAVIVLLLLTILLSLIPGVLARL